MNSCEEDGLVGTNEESVQPQMEGSSAYVIGPPTTGPVTHPSNSENEDKILKCESDIQALRSHQYGCIDARKNIVATIEKLKDCETENRQYLTEELEKVVETLSCCDNHLHAKISSLEAKVEELTKSNIELTTSLKEYKKRIEDLEESHEEDQLKMDTRISALEQQGERSSSLVRGRAMGSRDELGPITNESIEQGSSPPSENKGLMRKFLRNRSGRN